MKLSYEYFFNDELKYVYFSVSKKTLKEMESINPPLCGDTIKVLHSHIGYRTKLHPMDWNSGTLSNFYI